MKPINGTFKVFVHVIPVIVAIVFVNTLEIKEMDCSFNALFLNMIVNFKRVKMIKMIMLSQGKQ